VQIKACGKTDKGLSRSINEDHFSISEDPMLLIVADGMGGYAAGEIASQIAVDTASDQIKRVHTSAQKTSGVFDSRLSEEAKQLSAAIQAANQVIFLAAQRNRDWHGMGTTIAAVWLPSLERAVIAHVGDSRVYLVRDKTIRQLTRDHSIVGEQIQQGLLTQEEARHSPIKNVITRALGLRQEVEVDVAELALQPDDILLLCTDGLNTMVTDEEILAIVCQEKELAEKCDQLIEQTNQNGALDNTTVILAQCL
jgi:serine/threonine protein phosphatase PrpC